MGIYEFLLCVIGSLFFMAILAVSISIRVVRENTRLSVYRFGRFIGDKGPGIVLLIPFIDKGILKELGKVDGTPSTAMVGMVGETRSSVYTNGKVFLAGEEWDAVSQSPISAGQRIRVVRMIVEVEKE